MTLAELQALIGTLISDPNHDRYSLGDINTELDNVQDRWNIDAKIIKDTTTLTVVDGTRQYALSNLTGTPIAFPRATHKGLPLDKRSETDIDLAYGGEDWTTRTGTPREYFIEAEDPDNQYFTVFPTPGAEDAGANLVVEYIKRHTAMSASSDVPFMSGTSSNYLLRPYDQYLAYEVASKLLQRDPSQVNITKAIGADGQSGFMGIAKDGLDSLIQVFKQLEKTEPPKIRTFRGRGVVRWHP